MTLLKKKREILKKSSLCLGKGGVKYGNSFKTTGKKYNNSQKNPVVVVTTSTRAFFFCDDRETPGSSNRKTKWPP